MSFEKKLLDFDELIQHTFSSTPSSTLTKENADIYNQESWDCGRSFPDRSLELALKAEKVSSELCYTRGLAMSYLNQGWYYSSNTEFQQSEILFHKAAMLFEDIHDYEGVLKAYSGICGVNYFLGKYHIILEYSHRSLQLAEEIHNINRQISTHIISAQAYLQLKEFDTALQHSITAESLIEMLDNYDQYEVLYQTIGRVYLALGEQQYAREYFHKALRIQEKTQSPYNMPETLCLLAQTYDFKDENIMAEKYLLKALSLPHNNEESVLIAYSLGEFYYRQECYDKAFPFVQQCIQLCEVTGIVEYMDRAKELLFLISE